MTTLPTTAEETVSIEIGGMPIAVRTHDPSFRRLIENRYAGFVGTSPHSQLEFDIDLYEPSDGASAGDDRDDELEVKIETGEWLLRRGDFRARWNPEASRGHIRQSRSPYAIDAVLRIVHSLILARRGGFLVHAASAIRDGKAFLFSGISGAGKTTISRLAPPMQRCLPTRSRTCGAKAIGIWPAGHLLWESWRGLAKTNRHRSAFCFCSRKVCRIGSNRWAPPKPCSEC